MEPEEAILVRLVTLKGWRRIAPTSNLLPPSERRKTTLKERRAIVARKGLGGPSHPEGEGAVGGEEIDGGTLEPHSPDLSWARATLGNKA